jgi:hypothetical protein
MFAWTLRTGDRPTDTLQGLCANRQPEAEGWTRHLIQAVHNHTYAPYTATPLKSGLLCLLVIFTVLVLLCNSIGTLLTQQCWFFHERDWQNDDSWFLFTCKNCVDTESRSAPANHYKKAKGTIWADLHRISRTTMTRGFQVVELAIDKVRGQLHDPATSPMRREPKMMDGPRIRSGLLWTTDIAVPAGCWIPNPFFLQLTVWPLYWLSYSLGSS